MHPLTLRGAGLALTLALAWAAMYLPMIPLDSEDLRVFLLPWFDIIRERGFDAMAGEYTNYSPPYLYLLGIASRFADIAPPIALIKAVSICFTLLSAAVFAAIVRQATGRQSFALLSGFAFPLIPTVALNAAWWGQCDIVYTFFLLCTLLASLRGKPLLVTLFFAVAFSFKAQALVLAPYLLFLAWKGEIRWAYALLVPLVFAVMMVPAWMAGRDAAALATIYAHQGAYYQLLSMNAPNPWAVIRHAPWISYQTGVVVGAGAAALGCLAVVRKGMRLAGDPGQVKLIVAAMSVVLVPYLLPKMHDRYFFPADVFLVLLACVMPRFAAAAVAMQAGSLVVYAGYLIGDGPPRGRVSAIGFVFTTLALVHMLWQARSTDTRVDASSNHLATPLDVRSGSAGRP
jgi:Gpi18-like mannosyltransferase